MARIRKKKVNRSLGGDIATVLFLVLIGAFMVLPMLFAIGSSFKPTDELFRFPPTIFPQNWTTKNYSDLFVLMNTSWVPFTRYFFNTIFITGVGTIGQIICCSLCAFALALHRFPGNRFITKMIELAGGKNAFKTIGGEESASSITMEAEQFYSLAKDADIIIYNSTIDGEITSLEQLIAKNEILSDFKAVREGNVWCTKPALYQDSGKLGTAISELDLIFSDNYEVATLEFFFKLESGEHR